MEKDNSLIGLKRPATMIWLKDKERRNDLAVKK
jgi:hypothetical protein